MTFKNLNLNNSILEALHQKGYSNPTPIQEKAIPAVLEGRDLLGCAQTGTGKTAAFAIPTIQRLSEKRGSREEKRKIRALILTPTRELAIQVAENFSAYGKHTHLRHAVIYGGVPQRAQTTALKNGIDILIATPGRLLDLMNQRYVHLDSIEIFVLDEADRMLDMGFITDINRIVAKLPLKKQTLLFSATMPAEIRKLSNTLLTNPVEIQVSPQSTPAKAITQSVYFIDKSKKLPLLIQILKEESFTSGLIFTKTKRGADKVTKSLQESGIMAEAIHGDKSQGARQRALGNFKKKKTNVLVATDIASRGIDVHEMPLVINFELPQEAETYVHRIGRTGRAGSTGNAISFCDREEKKLLREINKLLPTSIPVIEDHAFISTEKAQNDTPVARERSTEERSGRNGKRFFRKDRKRSFSSNVGVKKKKAFRKERRG
jgi:ATP-dependent RNA helicase RhlE